MAPSLITSYLVNSAAQDITTLTTPSFTPANGEVIVVKVVTEQGGNPVIGAISNTSVAQTWAQQFAKQSSVTDCGIVLWTTTVAGTPGAMTVSVAASGTNGWHSMVVERWSGAVVPASPQWSWTQANTTCSLTMTTYGTNSVLSWMVADWNGVAPGTPAYRSSATQEQSPVTHSGLITAYWAYQSVPTANTTNTVGLTAPTGQKASIGAFEVVSSTQTVTPTGIASAEVFGTAALTLTVSPTGIAGSEALGTATLTPGPVTVSPTGIAGAEALGTPALSTLIGPTGIAGAEAFGAALVQLAGILYPTGIPSSETFGAATLSAGPVTVSPTGIPTGEQLGAAAVVLIVAPTGIPSAEALGAPTATTGPVVLAPAGISSAELFGATQVLPQPVVLTVPPGISSAEALGALQVNLILGVVGIPSSEAFGTQGLTTGPVGIAVPGIPSAEMFGATAVIPIIAAIRSQLIARPPATVSYELVCMARVPQPAGPPSLVVVDPIDWTGLTYTEELNVPPTLSASASISSLTETVLQRIRNLAELATELWLYRNGKLVFAGPWRGWQVQGETLTISAAGILDYLKNMWVTSYQVYTATDQFAIVTGLIDSWQTQQYGHYGIDTTGIKPSGIVRDAVYPQTELHNIGQRVTELGVWNDGFDISVNPSSRKLTLTYLRSGVDRSTGQDAVIFDDRNVTSPNIVCSMAPDDVASEVYASSQYGLYSTQSNLTTRAQYGKAGVTAQFDGSLNQAQLDSHALARLAIRSKALLIPGPDVRVTPDSDISAYDVGDVVQYNLHPTLGVTGAFRLKKRTVTVAKTGVESVSLGFV